jgi:FtsP/CotA-like multicopper oxidase with cupredoxin domain
LIISRSDSTISCCLECCALPRVLFPPEIPAGRHAIRRLRPAKAALPLWMIGAEGGFLPEPVRLDQVLLAPAERADVIVDFTGLEVGTEIYLINLGPDEPIGGLPAPFADPDHNRSCMWGSH